MEESERVDSKEFKEKGGMLPEDSAYAAVGKDGSKGGPMLFDWEADNLGLDRLVKVEKIENLFLLTYVASLRLKAEALFAANKANRAFGYDKNLVQELVRLKDLLASLGEAIEGGKIPCHQFPEIKEAINDLDIACNRKSRAPRHSVYLGNNKIASILRKCPLKKNPTESLTFSLSPEPVKSYSTFASTPHDDFPSEKNPNYAQSSSSSSIEPEKLSSDKTLVSSQRSEPPKQLQAANISEIPRYLVPLLAYCVLFPRGHVLVKEMLVNMWMAEGFLFPFDDNKDNDMQDIGNRYFDELLYRGVFLKREEIWGRVHSCVIHPLAHDVACRIAGEEVQVIDNAVSDSYSIKKDPSHISINLDGLSEHIIEELTTRYSHATTCLVFGNDDVNMRFPVKTSMRLRVLHLSRTQVNLVPSGSDLLKNLRYLGLSGNHNVVDVSRFKSLKTLAADGCFLQLGSRFWNMRSLYLTTEETTIGVYSFKLRILELSHCKDLKFVRCRSTRLRQLRIYDCPKLVSLPDFRGRASLAHLEELVLDYCVRLDLTGTEWKSIDNLPCLRHMELIGLHKLVDLPAGLRSATSLESFMIAGCPSFKSTGKVLQCLMSLEKLCIYNCPKLTTLEECAPNLQTLDIRGCTRLIERCSSNNGEDWKIICHIPQIVLDGKCSNGQKSDFSEDNNAADRSQFGAEGDLYISESFSYFNLKAQMSEKGLVTVEYNRWRILALVLRATTSLRIILKESLDKKLKYIMCFPKDYEFESDKLIQLWAAAGFPMSVCEEEFGKRTFNMFRYEEYIMSSRMDVLTGKAMYKVDVDKVTSHFSRTIEAKDGRNAMLGNETTDDDLSNAWHVTVVSNHIDRTTFQFQQLERISKLKKPIFVFNDYGCPLKQVPYSMFLALPSIQVLDLSRSDITEIPSSIGNVICLRYLDLSFTLIEKLPESIDCNKELQTLKLKGCKQLYTLPKGLKELRRLRHLEFDVLSRLSCMPKGMEALTELRTLSGFIVGNTEKDCHIEVLKNLKNLRGSLCISGLERLSQSCSNLISNSQITHLYLRWSNFKVRDQRLSNNVLDDLKPNLSCIEKLHILSFPGSRLPLWMGDARNKLVHITLLKCESNLQETLGGLPNLKYLRIIQMNKVTIISRLFCGAIQSIGFPKLEELVINGMFGLQCWRGVQRNDFPLLNKFIVMHCPKLISLPFLSFMASLNYLEISYCEMFKSLPGKLPESLETLIINECPLLIQRCSKEGDDWDNIKHVPHIWIDQINIHSSHEDTDDDNSDDDDNSKADSQAEEDQLDWDSFFEELDRHDLRVEEQSIGPGGR